VKTALVTLFQAALPNSQVIYGPRDNASVISGRVVVVGSDDTEFDVQPDSLGMSTSEEYILPCVLSVSLPGSDQNEADTQAFDDYAACRDAVSADPSLAGAGVFAYPLGVNRHHPVADSNGRSAAVFFGIQVHSQNT
jgi:hypothetical protein